jgi:hypothetical protein
MWVFRDLFLREDPKTSTGLDGAVIMLIVGLELENSATGATLGLYIKASDGRDGPRHEQATSWHAIPLPEGWTHCPTATGAFGPR